MASPKGKGKGKGNTSMQKRTCFLTPEHKFEIATMVLANRDVIRGGVGLDSKTTAIRKTELWQNIYDHVTAMGAVIHDVHHLRKVRTKHVRIRLAYVCMFFMHIHEKSTQQNNYAYFGRYKSMHAYAYLRISMQFAYLCNVFAADTRVFSAWVCYSRNNLTKSPVFSS